jgi:hypothetical protein
MVRPRAGGRCDFPERLCRNANENNITDGQACGQPGDGGCGALLTGIPSNNLFRGYRMRRTDAGGKAKPAQQSGFESMCEGIHGRPCRESNRSEASHKVSKYVKLLQMSHIMCF